MVSTHYEERTDEEHGYADESRLLCVHRVFWAETNGCDDPAISVMKIGNVQEQLQRLRRCRGRDRQIHQ